VREILLIFLVAILAVEIAVLTASTLEPPLETEELIETLNLPTSYLGENE
jgi:hypothetical protein